MISGGANTKSPPCVLVDFFLVCRISRKINRILVDAFRLVFVVQTAIKTAKTTTQTLLGALSHATQNVDLIGRCPQPLPQTCWVPLRTQQKTNGDPICDNSQPLPINCWMPWHAQHKTGT